MACRGAFTRSYMAAHFLAIFYNQSRTVFFFCQRGGSCYLPDPVVCHGTQAHSPLVPFSSLKKKTLSGKA